MKHASAEQPFPGLRPFEFDDRAFFFGREEQITTLYAKLLQNRFIAIVGSSGSGKSSLVRAGLLKRLAEDNSVLAGSAWKTILMRPLGGPLLQLGRALARGAPPRDVGQDSDMARIVELAADRAVAHLSRSSAGLVDLLREVGADSRSRLLLIVDQFEEMFRYAPARPEADFDERALFVKHLLAAAADPSLRIHVLTTMRSEFIGDCAQFRDLPEAVSDSQFLTPRLTREQRRDAILMPVQLAGGEMEPALLQRILNDVGHETDQLPVMQHALMRTWQMAARRRSLTLDDYDKIGGMQSALTLHGEGLLQKRTKDEGSPGLRSDKEKRDVERIFRALTDVDRDGRATRRPMPFAELASQCSSPEAAAALIDVFRDEDCAFLSPHRATLLEDSTIVDITHEALIRKWSILSKWVEQESEDGKNILRLHELATRRCQDREFTLGAREAAERTRWWREIEPTAPWARRYLDGNSESKMEEIRELLEASAERATRDARLQRQAEEAQLQVERLLRERAEHETREKERELQLEQMARKLTEAQRQKLASRVPLETAKATQSVFISFAQEDKQVAIEVFDWLIDQGLEKIHLGLDTQVEEDAWREKQRDAILSARAVVLIVSRAWAVSRWCQQELKFASEGEKYLIPVLLDRVDLSAVVPHAEEFQVTHWHESGAKERLRASLARVGLVEEFFSYVPGRSPYPGLAGFEEEDASVFFGRSAQIVEAMNRLRTYRHQGGCHILAILGASGSGKSSFLRAGLWARLKRDSSNFLCLPIRPPREWYVPAGGLDLSQMVAIASAQNLVLHDHFVDLQSARGSSEDDPSAEKLESVLKLMSDQLREPNGSPVGIVFAIDQAEELFRPEAEQTLQLLSHRIQSLVERNRAPLTIIFSIRSGDFDHLQTHPILGKLKCDVFSLAPITAGSFRAVIEGPAHVAGLELDPLLVDRLLADVEEDRVSDAGGGAHDAVEFNWDGNDEMDEARGAGWAALQPDGSLIGEIHFLGGDEIFFIARPCTTSSTAC